MSTEGRGISLCYAAAVRVAVAVRAPILAALLAASCAGPNAISDADREAIEVLLREYAQRMSEAYVDGDVSRLAELATEREQHRLSAAIAELSGSGRGLRPTLRSLAIESIDRAGSASVAVGTLEVWDLEVVALGSGQTVSESPGQENRLSYSLVRERGQWRILSRLLRTSTEAP